MLDFLMDLFFIQNVIKGFRIIIIQPETMHIIFSLYMHDVQDMINLFVMYIS